jgi:hypothetical protein
MFKPKLLLATAKARHLAASGRRASYMAFIVARAAFFGSVRLARAQGRKAARAEIIRSLCEMRANRATLKAQAHLASVQSKAIRCNKRVQAASLQRSIARLSLLNNAIEAEQKRQAAELQRAVMLQSRAVTARAAARVEQFVTRRRELRVACMAKGIAKEGKCFEASCLRHLHLSGVVASAKRAQRGTVRIHPEATSVVRKALAGALVSMMKAGDVDAARAEAVARAALVSEAAASAAAAKAEGKGAAAAPQAAKAATIKKAERVAAAERAMAAREEDEKKTKAKATWASYSGGSSGRSYGGGSGRSYDSSYSSYSPRAATSMAEAAKVDAIIEKLKSAADSEPRRHVGPFGHPTDRWQPFSHDSFESLRTP